MNSKLLVGIIIGVMALAGCGRSDLEVRIVPEPASIEVFEESYRISSVAPIYYQEDNEDVRMAAEYLQNRLKQSAGLALDLTETVGNPGKGISLIIEDLEFSKHPEAYQLIANGNEVSIKANSARGVFYGVQSLLQLLPPEVYGSQKKLNSKDLVIKQVEIRDEPAYDWRGMHLDVGRHLFPVEFIKKYIDLIAMHKMNVFHWHLTEDQGWRIEIKKYPRLTEIGSVRTYDDGTTYGGFYTQEQIREVVEYARTRFVDVMPEIEMPGHSVAALAAYPDFSCTGGPFKVRTAWGIEDDVYCAGKEETFEFLEDVIDEVVDLFPFRYFHIGGDESPKVRWESCSDCQKRIRQEGLEDEHELQSYFIQRIEKYLITKDRQLVGWDEILEGGLAPEATVMSWRGIRGGVEAAKQMHDVVMSPTGFCYFDYYQGDRRFEPNAIGGYITLERVYSYQPTPEELSPEEAKHILGAQGNVWTEYIPDEQQVEYMALPRMSALAEVVWTPEAYRDYEKFLYRMNAQYDRLDAIGVNYRVPPPTVLNQDLTLTDTVVLELKNSMDVASIHYTTDGSDPVLTSPELKGSLVITKPTLVKAATLMKSGHSSHVIELDIQRNYLDEDPESFDQRMQWWRDATFGMFIHWGAYAVPAGVYQGKRIGGIGEWIMDRAHIPIPEYENFVEQFNPVKFDADQWAQIARDAGMKYMVITSKHHDGFCLWDSKITDYDIIDYTPFGRDILKELAVACKKAGVRLCFYHSIMDWHHPDAKGANFESYRENYLIPQLEELLSGDYGDVGVLWFDGEWISEWTEEQGKALYQYLRSIKPDLIINNRVGKGRRGMQGMNKDRTYAGDFGTPEQEILDESSGLDWESCMTMNDTWGFKTHDHNWKSSYQLIYNLVDVVAKGGNYLLNVGPDAEGLIPEPSVERLQDIGEWIRVNKKAVYKTNRFSHFKEGDLIRYAYDENKEKVFVYLLDWPGSEVVLSYVQPDDGSKIHLLGYRKSLDWTYDEKSGLTVELPESLQDSANRPCQHVWVLELEAKSNPVVEAPVIVARGKKNPTNIVFNEPIGVTLSSSTKGADIRYTLDGSAPDENSLLYEKAVRVEDNGILKARAFKKGMVRSPITSVGLIITNSFESVSLKNPPSEKYQGEGVLSLYDNLRGEVDFQIPTWLGFEGEDLIATIDLGSVEKIHEIKVGFLQNISSWIFLPAKTEFLISENGQNYQSVGEMLHVTTEKTEGKMTKDMAVQVNARPARYIKVIAKNVGVCPSWHPGSGGKAWIFCDEIMVN